MSRKARKSSETAPPKPPIREGAVPPAPTQTGKTLPAAPPKRWAFRWLAMAGVPLICLGLLELALRLAGVGYPTAFLVRATEKGAQVLIQNNRFGWRFFGANMARNPFPICIANPKPAHTVRIFVLGESAAFGDPQPRFGLARMLEAMLSLRHPGVAFQVVNAAMTGINSHVILPIARDCAQAQGDVWVIYMGNNEVVGPFGAGTVFGSQAPPLPLIRGSLALESTRIGQALDGLRRKLQPPNANQGEWGGMRMFLDQQVRPEDPRMARVRLHFERNLIDIIEAGRRAGARIVVSTVAVNLKDCAPFGSLHRAAMSTSEADNWGHLVQQGIAAQEAGDYRQAADRFRLAAQLDDTFADLRFRQGCCALGRGEPAEAQGHFRAACDWDSLRFRCDSRLNDLTRKVAAQTKSGEVVLVDGERALAEQSQDQLPGQDLFYDHVHLTFAGNYWLARAIAPAIEKLLPAAATAASRPWPLQQACAQRLAWTDSDRHAALSEVLSRLSDPPFTGQLTHATQTQRLVSLMEQLGAATQPAATKEAEAACQRALGAAPDDPWLYAKLALLQRDDGDWNGATASARRLVELIPSSGESWAQLGLILAQQQQYAEAASAFGRAFALDSQDVWALQNLAQALEKLGRHDEAMRDYRRCLATKPGFGLAWIGLGQVLEATGRKTEAEDCYQKALTNRVHWAEGLATLARFCVSRGWMAAAATNYEDALQLNPADARLHLEAARAWEALGQEAKAAAQYAQAARWAPDWGQARFLYGLILGRQGKAAQAVEEFTQAVRLLPELPEAKVDLGIALTKAGRETQALAEFEEVLERDPTNAVARQNAQFLRGKLGSRK